MHWLPEEHLKQAISISFDLASRYIPPYQKSRKKQKQPLFLLPPLYRDNLRTILYENLQTATHQRSLRFHKQIVNPAGADITAMIWSALPGKLLFSPNSLHDVAILVIEEFNCFAHNCICQSRIKGVVFCSNTSIKH